LKEEDPKEMRFDNPDYTIVNKLFDQILESVEPERVEKRPRLD